MVALTGPGVERAGDPGAVALREARHALTLREILTQQTVGVLVGAALPGVMRGREVERGPPWLDRLVRRLLE